MNEVKRGPGRPKGSETDDSVPLMMMARLLMDDPKLAAKTAARRVFKSGSWGRSSEDASIHRWQGKWKTDGEAYKARVQAERAEAERRDREAAHARQIDRRSRYGFAAGGLAARHADWALCSSVQKHADLGALMRPSKDLLAVANAMPRMGLSRFDLVANPALAGVNVGDTVRRSLEIANATGIGEAMRKLDTIGRAMEKFSAVHLPKLPKGF